MLEAVTTSTSSGLVVVGVVVVVVVVVVVCNWIDCGGCVGLHARSRCAY